MHCNPYKYKYKYKYNYNYNYITISGCLCYYITFPSLATQINSINSSSTTHVHHWFQPCTAQRPTASVQHLTPRHHPRWPRRQANPRETDGLWRLIATFQGLTTRQGIVGSMGIPEIILGGASISAQYNSDNHLNSDMPLRTVRLALRCVPAATATTRFLTRSQ